MRVKDKAALYDSRTKNITLDIPSLIRLLKIEENILEVGSGTGRVLKQLAIHGFQNINGVELNETFFKASLLKLKPYMNHISVYKINFLDVNLPHILAGEKFDKIIFFFNVFAEFIDIDEQLAALAQAKKLLKKNGRILLYNPVHKFDNWGKQVVEYKFDIKDDDDSTWECNLRCRRDNNSQMSYCEVYYKNSADGLEINDSYKVSLLTRNELLCLFKLSNLRVEKEYGSYELEPFLPSSELMIHVLRKEK